MADGQMNIRVNVDLNDMRRKAEEYRKEVTKMGVVTDESGNVISTAWQRVSDAAKKSNISRITEEMTGDVSANIEIQKKVLKDLEEQYKNVSKAVEDAAPGVAKSKLQQELSAIKKEIDGEKQALQELEKVQQQYGQSNLTLRTQIYNVRNEMGRLRMQGQTNTEQYRQLEAELGRLGTAYRQLQYEQKALSTGATQWGGIISGIQGVTGAFAAAQGVMGLFVTDNEKLAKIQTRLQAVMAITIGMQQVSNTLHATSAFRMTTVRRVTELFTGAQTKLATALGISALKAQVLMGTLTLGLSAAITGIIYLINKWSSAQKKAAEEQKNIIDAQKRAAESIGEQVVSFKKLQKGWNELGDDLEKKKKYIIDNKDEMDKLGISVNNVSDAENLFVLNGDKFINALSIKAKAIASMELATEKYKKSISEMVEAEEKATKRLKEEILKRASGEKGEEIFKSTVDLLKDKDGFEKFSQQTWGKNIDFEKIFSKYNQAVEKFEEEGAKVDNFLKQQSEEFKKYINILKDAGFTTTEEDEANKDAEEQAEKERKAAEARKKVLEKINEELLALERKNQQSRIDLMEEGREKELAQIRQDYKEKIAEIKKQSEKWAAEQGGTLTVEQTVEITTAYNNAKKGKAADEKKIWEDEVKAEREAMQEYIKEYGTYQEKRIIIAKQYAEKIASAQTSGEKMSLEKERDKAIQDLDQSMVEQTDFWTRLFSDASEHTNQYISQIISDTEKLIDYIEGKGGVEIPVGFSDEQINSLKKDPEKVKTILEELKKKRDALNTRNPFRGMIDGFKDLKEAGTDAEAQMKAIGDIINSMNGASTIISGIGGALESMGSKAGSVLNDVANVVGETASMAQTGASLGGPIGAAVGAAIGLATSLTKLFTAKHDAKRDKRIAQLQEQIDEIDKENAKLEKTADSQYGENKRKSLEEENANLEKQNALIEQQIAEEKDKKKSDQGKIDEYNRQLEANREKIAENKDAALDAVMGEDIKTAIERFADAYAEAWAKNEKSASGAKDAIKKQMQQMVKTAIQNYIEASGKMAEIRKKMDEYFADGVFTEAEEEALYRMAEELDKEVEERFGANKRLYQESEEDLKRQTGTISETITEKTANESMGIWRGSYDTLKAINQQTTMFHETYKSTMATCNSILNTIARNTGETANNTSVLSEVRDTLNKVDGRLRTIESKASEKYAR